MGLRDRLLRRLLRTLDGLTSPLIGATSPTAGHTARTPAWPPHGMGVMTKAPGTTLHPAERAAAGLPLLPLRPRAAPSPSTVPAATSTVLGSAPPRPTTRPTPPATSEEPEDLWASFDFGPVSQEEYLPPPRLTEAPPRETPPPRPVVSPRPVPDGPLGDDEREEVKQKIIAAIKTVYDPEIPVDIWELGLIYAVDVDAERRVEIRMTLTSPSCPSAQTLPVEVEQRSSDVEGVLSSMVDVVWDPPWGPHLMSEVAKLELNID